MNNSQTEKDLVELLVDTLRWYIHQGLPERIALIEIRSALKIEGLTKLFEEVSRKVHSRGLMTHKELEHVEKETPHWQNKEARRYLDKTLKWFQSGVMDIHRLGDLRLIKDSERSVWERSFLVRESFKQRRKAEKERVWVRWTERPLRMLKPTGSMGCLRVKRFPID